MGTIDTPDSTRASTHACSLILLTRLLLELGTGGEGVKKQKLVAHKIRTLKEEDSRAFAETLL